MKHSVAVVLAVLVALAAGPAFAQAQNAKRVDLQLVIAVDVSQSVDRNEATLQRDGYAKALLDPNLLKAIKNGRNGRIAITYLEWAGWGLFRHTVDWTVIDGEDSARQFIAQMNSASIVSGRGTSIATAIDVATSLFPISPFPAERRVIDISGDGANNQGLSVTAYKDMALAQGITINGLPILNDQGGVGGSVADLDVYYSECVIGGPGSFVIAEQNFESFGQAILRKLILEVAGLGPLDDWERFGVPRTTKVQYFGPPAGLQPAPYGGTAGGPKKYYPYCDIPMRGTPTIFPSPF